MATAITPCISITTRRSRAPFTFRKTPSWPSKSPPITRTLVPFELKRIKSQITYLQYITDTRSGQKIIISDNEMQRFIAVAGTYNDHLMYFQPNELNLSKGTRVRVIGCLLYTSGLGGGSSDAAYMLKLNFSFSNFSI